MATALAKLPSITRLSDRIIRILGCNPGPMTLQGTNSYIIGTGQRRILLDTTESGASASDYIDLLKKVFADENCTISHILLSHWHHDHVGAIANVLELKDYLSNCTVWKFPSAKYDDAALGDVKAKVLVNDQEFKIDGATLHILHTPGHTTDHIVVLIKEENAIFTGDCILGEGTAVFEDLYDYMNSLNKILELKPSILYPAHGSIITEAHDKIYYYIEHRKERERQIIEVLRANPIKQFTEMDLVKDIYKETPGHLWKAAAYNVNHHLNKLLRENRVTKLNDMWQYKDASKM